MKAAIRPAVTIAIAAALVMPSVACAERGRPGQGAAGGSIRAGHGTVVRHRHHHHAAPRHRHRQHHGISGQRHRRQLRPAGQGRVPRRSRLQPAGDARGDDADGRRGGAPQHVIQTVRESYAWNESEIGAGLVPERAPPLPPPPRSRNGFSSSGRCRTAW